MAAAALVCWPPSCVEERNRRTARAHPLIYDAVLSKMVRVMQLAITEQPIWNFEQEPFGDERPDETSINLRAYFDRMPDEKMRQYQPSWTDEQVVEWCGDFRDDGALFLACCERDVEVEEFRSVLQQAIAYRNRVRPQLMGAGK